MESIILNRRQRLLKLVLITVFGLCSSIAVAQINPTDSLPGDPGGIIISTVQQMHFGAFSNSGNGGTVSISNTGMRSATGSIIPLNMGVNYMQAMFDLDAPQGCIISIMNGPDAVLTGSNGGTMSMHIGPADPSSPFIVLVAQPAKTRLSVGGTLTIGNSVASPPGNYSGTFYILFNQE